jgi:hypothetical protein
MDCLVWKCVCEEEIVDAKPKVGVNVAMVEWDQPLVDVCVMIHGRKTLLPKADHEEIELNPTRGQQIKWDKEKKVHRDVLQELELIQAKDDVPMVVAILRNETFFIDKLVSKDIQGEKNTMVISEQTGTTCKSNPMSIELDFKRG